MSRFVEGENRRQPRLLRNCLDDYVAEDDPVLPHRVQRLAMASTGIELGRHWTNGMLPRKDGWQRLGPRFLERVGDHPPV